MELLHLSAKDLLMTTRWRCQRSIYMKKARKSVSFQILFKDCLRPVTYLVPFYVTFHSPANLKSQNITRNSIYNVYLNFPQVSNYIKLADKEFCEKRKYFFIIFNELRHYLHSPFCILSNSLFNP